MMGSLKVEERSFTFLRYQKAFTVDGSEAEKVREFCQRARKAPLATSGPTRQKHSFLIYEKEGTDPVKVFPQNVLTRGVRAIDTVEVWNLLAEIASSHPPKELVWNGPA